MILEVLHFKDGIPVPLSQDYDAGELDIEFIDFHYLKPIALTGTAERIYHTLSFRGTLNSQVEQICARCLESTATTMSAPFELSYEIGTQEKIDTTGDLRDVLILCHPDRFLCQNDCRGLCPDCGVNLNRENCQCQKK